MSSSAPSSSSPSDDTPNSSTGPAPTCKVPVDLTPALPDKLPVIQGDLTAAPLGGPQVDLVPKGQVIDAMYQQMNQFFLERGFGYLAAPVFIRFVTLWAMKTGLKQDQPPVRRPQNADMVPDAARAVIKAATTVPAGAAMEVDVPEMQKGVDEIAFLQEVLAAVEGLPDLVRQNLAQAEDKVAKKVDAAVGQVEGKLLTHAQLRRTLSKATKWRGAPAEKGKETRADHHKLTEKVTAEVKASEETGHPAPPPPATTPPPASPPPAGPHTVPRSPAPSPTPVRHRKPKARPPKPAKTRKR